MRDAFVQSLIRRNQSGGDCYLLVGDLGYSVIEPYISACPERYINIGVAEQNMAGIAAGIASEGHRVFFYSIGNFSTFRCAEQIRNDIDYHDLPVCIVSVGGGVAYGNMGYSHHAIQDFALMRSMPNTMILSPVDSIETELCMDCIHDGSFPAYLRLHKAGEDRITHDASPIVPGLPRHIYGPRDARIALLSTGYTGQGAYQIARENNTVVFFTLPAWGMKYRTCIRDFVANYDLVITFEDHLIDAGFGSWVLESLMGTNLIAKVRCQGLQPDLIGVVGTESFLHHLSGLYNLSAYLG